MRTKKTPHSVRPPRVVWTAREKDDLIRRAVDIQSEHPDLAGLPLLRAAMHVLPETRRRHLLAVTQAPWFEPGVTAEVRRRTMEIRAGTDLGAVMREHAHITDEINVLHHEWLAFHRDWRTEAARNHEGQVATLNAILVELRELNTKLGQPVPVQAPCSCSTRNPIRSRKPGVN